MTADEQADLFRDTIDAYLTMIDDEGLELDSDSLAWALVRALGSARGTSS
ncbi:hypothetical protein ACFYN3_41620 [Streptomyces lavendulae]